MRVLGVVARLATVGSVLLALASTAAVAAVHLTGEQLLIAVSGSMAPAFRTGDAVLVHRPRPVDLRVGQIISFHPPGKTTLKTHRIYALRPEPSGLFVQTKGDANPAPDPDFTPVGSVVGVFDARLPYAGYWLALYRDPRGRLLVCGVPLLLLLIGQLRDLAGHRRGTAERDPRGRRKLVPLVPATVIGVVAALALTAAGIALGSVTGAVYADTTTIGANTLTTNGCFYQRAVTAVGPAVYYRLNDAAATTAVDSAAAPHNGTYTGTWTTGAPGPLTCTPNSAVTVGGSASYIAGSQQQPAPPTTFTLEVWIKTTSTNAEILGYGSAQTGNSTSISRVLFLDGTGHLALGVATTASAARTVATTGTYNDGAWHLVDVTFSAATGTVIYVDGSQVAGDTATATYNSGSGYLRVGYDDLAGCNQAWTTAANQYTGSMDEIAVYTSALSATQVSAHYAAL